MRKIVKYGLIEILVLVFFSVPMGWNINGDGLYFKNVFMYVRPVSILIFLYAVCKDMAVCRRVFLCIENIYSKYYIYVWCGCLTAFLGGYQLWYAYYTCIYISPDSSQYLREALNILAGYGFNDKGLLGLDGWFASWPIGYPALIALVSKITTFNVYLSSKLLSAVMMLMLLYVLQKRFNKNAFFVTFIFFNAGFLYVYKYTWSEIPFIFFAVMYGFSLTDVLIKKDIKSSIMLCIWTILAFLMRYVGIYLGVVSGVVWAGMLIHYWYGGRKEAASKKNLICLFISGITSAAFVGCYFLNNYVHCGFMTGVNRSLMKDDYGILTVNLQNSLINELLNVFNIVKPDYLSDMKKDSLAWIFVIFLIFILWIVKRNYNTSINVRKVFACIGGFYYLCFIYIRFHSSMDKFGSRFFIPGTILIEIAFFDWLSEYLKNYTKKVCLAATAILLVITISIWGSVLKSNYNESAYAKSRDEVLALLQNVPPNSYVFGTPIEVEKAKYLERVHRPDVSCDGNPQFSSYDNFMDFVAARADEGYGCVCMLRSVFETVEGYEEMCDKLSISKEDKDWETMILDTETYTLLLK